MVDPIEPGKGADPRDPWGPSAGDPRVASRVLGVSLVCRLCGAKGIVARRSGWSGMGGKIRPVGAKPTGEVIGRAARG